MSVSLGFIKAVVIATSLPHDTEMLHLIFFNRESEGSIIMPFVLHLHSGPFSSAKSLLGIKDHSALKREKYTEQNCLLEKQC